MNKAKQIATAAYAAIKQVVSSPKVLTLFIVCIALAFLIGLAGCTTPSVGVSETPASLDQFDQADNTSQVLTRGEVHQIIQAYKAEYGPNWDDWPADARERAESLIEQLRASQALIEPEPSDAQPLASWRGDPVRKPPTMLACSGCNNRGALA